MSRPFELKLYPPPNQPDEDCDNCDGRGCMGCVFREYDHDCRNDCPMCCYYNEPADKRLTDAELAAVYWCWILSAPHHREPRDRKRTLERFATMQHHDEAIR